MNPDLRRSGSSGTALARPETARALRRYRLRAAGAVVAGVAGFVLTALVLAATGYPEVGPWAWLWTVMAGVSLLVLLTGMASAGHGLRMRRVLARSPWTVRACRFRDAVPGDPYGQPVLVVHDAAGRGPAHAFRVAAAPHRLRHLHACDGAVVWFCGDPDRGGVVSPPGGERLMWARPVRMTVWRRHLVRRTAVRRARARAEPAGTNPAGA